jgi:adenylate kinase
MIVLYGPTGSGKSVQGKMLADRHGWRWLSAGELLRQTNNPKISSFQLVGKMVPDSVINDLMFAEIAKSQTAGEENKIILDGYPREAKQAKALSRQEFDRIGREPINLVVNLKINRTEILKRLNLRARPEDTLETIENRLKLHDEQAKGIEEYYRDLGVETVNVDGVGSVGEVHDRIEKVLENRKIVREF